MALAYAKRRHAFRIVRKPSARRRLDGISAGPNRHRQAPPLGARPDVDPGKRTDLSARIVFPGSHPRRSARCAGRALGNGGRLKMLLPFGRDRRAVGRPERTRFYSYSPACGRVGAQRHTLLACPAWRECEPQRREDALANRERSFIASRTRPARSGNASMECRAFPCSWDAARTLDHRS